MDNAWAGPEWHAFPRSILGIILEQRQINYGICDTTVKGWHRLSTFSPRLIRQVRHASRGKIGKQAVLGVIAGLESERG